MREDARFLSHTANSVTNHQITKRRYRSAAANLTDADTHGRAAVASFSHVPEVVEMVKPSAHTAQSEPSCPMSHLLALPPRHAPAIGQVRMSSDELDARQRPGLRERVAS